jgi:acyl-CoA thioesterase
MDTVSQYDDETAVERIDEHRFKGRVNGAWNIGDNPNGGYLLSLTSRALQAAVDHPDPLSITTHYLRPGLAEAECEIEVDVIRTGRTLSTARARLVQEGKARLEVLAAFSDLSVPAGVDAEISMPKPALPDPEDCLQRSAETQGVQLPILDRLDTRLDPACAVPGGSDAAVMQGLIRFIDGRAPDARSLLLFTDSFPPSPLPLLGTIGWVPTLELTVHVRRRPAPGWITARFQTDDLHEGRMVETGALWDSTGQLVAQSRQIGLVMKRD